MISTPTTSSVSSGAEGTDTGKSSMSNSASGEKIGSDTALRNGSNGLNNSIQQQHDLLKSRQK